MDEGKRWEGREGRKGGDKEERREGVKKNGE